MLGSAEEDLLSFLSPCTDPHNRIGKQALLSTAIQHPKNRQPAEFPDSLNKHESRAVLCTQVMLGAQKGLQLENKALQVQASSLGLKSSPSGRGTDQDPQFCSKHGFVR